MSPIEFVSVLAGALVVLATLGSAVRTVVLPRAIPARLSRYVFRLTRALFRLRAGRRPSYEKSDRIMALYAPVGLLSLILTWELLLLGAFTAIFWSIGERPLARAFTVSGSSLLTLGTAAPNGPAGTALSFAEAVLGLLLLALLITFLPSLYGAFSRREVMVALLEVRAGSPPSAEEMIWRFHRIHGLNALKDQWSRWELWFAEIEETHTSFPALVFFRSPNPERSWITAAGAVLDAAALRASTLDLPREPEAELCIRAGYVALNAIAKFFRLPYDPNPRPDDPISIRREEFDALCVRFADHGIPIKEDRDQAWRDYAGWRVNYDKPLVALVEFTMAPFAPWSSDRLQTKQRSAHEVDAGQPSPVTGQAPRGES